MSDRMPSSYIWLYIVDPIFLMWGHQRWCTREGLIREGMVGLLTPCKGWRWVILLCSSIWTPKQLMNSNNVTLSSHQQVQQDHILDAENCPCFCSMFITWISPNGWNIMATYQFNSSLTTSVIGEEFVKPCDILISDDNFVAQRVSMWIPALEVTPKSPSVRSNHNENMLLLTEGFS